MKKIKINAQFIVYENVAELSEDDTKLYLASIKARDKAYAPYSKFNVGVSLLLENNKIILGNNQENAAYPSGMCAERVAIWNASSQFPNIKILKMFITAKSKKRVINKPVPPCGACRQTLSEYEINQDTSIEFFFTGEEGIIIKSNSIKDLLPLSFDKDLL